jgi:hypothetical protein
MDVELPTFVRSLASLSVIVADPLNGLARLPAIFIWIGAFSL